MRKLTLKKIWIKLLKSRLGSLIQFITGTDKSKGTTNLTSEPIFPDDNIQVGKPPSKKAGAPSVADSAESDRCIEFSRYSTNPKDFQTWVDKIINWFGLPGLLASAVLAGLIFGGGLIIAWSISFHYEYLISPHIYIGVFGIFWTCYFIHFGSRRIHSAFEELRPCFLVSDEHYKNTITDWFQRMIDTQRNIFTALALFILALIVIYLGFYEPEIIRDLKVQSMRPHIVAQHGWYNPEHLTVKALIIVYYAVFVTLLLATGGRILVLNTKFLITLRSYPVIPIPNIIYLRLKQTVSLYLIIAMTWFGGVALFGVLLFGRLDVFSVSCLILLSFLGFLIFLTPQFVYRKYLVSSGKMASQWILRGLYKRFGFDLKERHKAGLMSNEKGAELASMSDFSGFIQAASIQRQWIYNPTDLLILLFGQAAALLSIFFHDLLEILNK